MILMRLPPPKLTGLALAAVTSVVLLTGYCQLTSNLGEGVPVSVSLQWALVNTATLAAFMGPLWISRFRIFAWIEEGRAANLVATVGIVFGAAACSTMLSTLINSALWGYGIHLAGLSKRFLALLPFLLAAAVAVTAVIAAFRWRSAKSVPQFSEQRPGADWLELPEAPLLKVRTSDMAVIRTARNYCELEVAGRPVLVRITAKQLEHRLAPHGFVRVHRGAIVNISRVRVVQRGRSGCLRLLLDDGSEIAVSKGHRDVFTQRLAATTRTAFQEDWAA
jgi:hypothetical protein